MTKPVHTRTFKSGDVVTIRLTRDAAEERRRMLAGLDALKALPKPPRIQKREPIEFPERRGL